MELQQDMQLGPGAAWICSADKHGHAAYLVRKSINFLLVR
jgi:hypothetical protein